MTQQQKATTLQCTLTSCSNCNPPHALYHQT